MDSRQARELLETLKGAGSVWSWTLHPQGDDLNEIAHTADLIGAQVSAFIFRRTLDSIERGDLPETVSILVDVDTGTPLRGAFTCPRCGRTSYNPSDAKYGYCGACHDFTDPHHPSPDTTRVGGSEPTGPA